MTYSAFTLHLYDYDFSCPWHCARDLVKSAGVDTLKVISLRTKKERWHKLAEVNFIMEREEDSRRVLAKYLSTDIDDPHIDSYLAKD